MAEKLGHVAGMIMAEVNQASERATDRIRANIVIELATLSLMIEAGITTAESVAQRVEQILKSLPEPFQGDAVSLRVNSVIDLLKDHVPPSSPK